MARNELSLVKLRERIEGRRPKTVDDVEAEAVEPQAVVSDEADDDWAERHVDAEPIRDDSLIVAKAQLNEAVEDLLDVIRNPEVLASIGAIDRTNLAKYLTIAKLRLENAIAVVRSGDADRER